MYRLLLLTAFASAGLPAQTPVTRVDAVAAVLARGPRVLAARADSAVARAELASARAFPNPVLSASYTKSVPRYHAILDIPVDWPWLRAPRVGAASAAATASVLRAAFARALARFEAETSYTAALAAAARARLAARNARDADTLVTVATLRRDAGDASEMDVRLAAISAGQAVNQAADDSLAALAALLDLQQMMGLPGDSARIALADTLSLPALTENAGTGVPLSVAAAEADLRAAERALSLEHAINAPSPSVQVGVENGDPTGQESGLLPTVGLSLPLPFFNQNGGGIARGRAERDRATAELAFARRESDAAIAQASRERTLAFTKVARDAPLLAGADSVAAAFLTAYAEGAVSLPEALEARRSAREALARYVDDLVTARAATELVQLLRTSETE
jgi:outer membrane protein, heavy metal efflux system